MQRRYRKIRDGLKVSSLQQKAIDDIKKMIEIKEGTFGERMYVPLLRIIQRANGIECIIAANSIMLRRSLEGAERK
jgi:hypothetical protein